MRLILGRESKTFPAAFFEMRHYKAIVNMFRVVRNPSDALRRYLTLKGEYPMNVSLRTPVGDLRLTLYSHHDMLTVNEIFCRGDYAAQPSDKIFVDFGSNIGISVAYFLTRSPSSYAYLYEPLPQNIERLRLNLAGFDARYELAQVAVGTGNGSVQFFHEESGRYGGVLTEDAAKGHAQWLTIQVKCVDSNEILERIISVHQKIDVLKIDIETLEAAVTERIPRDLAKRIGKIYVEYFFPTNPRNESHSYKQYGFVAQMILRRN